MDNTNQRVAVYGLILNQVGEVLLVKRSMEDSYPGIWEMPGGALEFGEQPQIGALREVKEETNLEVEILYPITTLSGFSGKSPHTQVVRITFLCLCINANLTKLSHEHIDYKWVKPENIEEPIISDLLKATLQVIAKYPKLITPYQDK